MVEQADQYLVMGEQAGSRYALALPRAVPMGAAGSQLGQRAGASLEFKEHRDYQPGDDLRRIDWSAYARSDRLSIKLFREEVNPHLDLLIDCSASMDLAESRKGGATLALAAALATAAGNSHCTTAVWLGRDGCRKLESAATRATAWPQIAFDHRGPLDQSFAQLAPAWRPQSVRILISDLLWIADPLRVLQPMAQRAATVVVIQLLAEADVDPPQRGNMRLVDSETAEVQDVFVDAAAQQRYRNTLTRHQDHWRRAASQVGAVMVDLVAERLLDSWDLRPLIEAQIIAVQ